MDATMTTDPAALLEELVAMPREQVVSRLGASRGDQATLEVLCEEVERLATSDVGRAMTAAEVVIALSDATGAPRLRAEARRVEAVALSYAGRYVEALRACTASMSLAESAGLQVPSARARLATVHPLSECGRYDEAIAAGIEARATLEAAGEHELAARADFSIGATYDRRDDPARALEHYDRALRHLGSDPLVAAQIESNRGVALIGLDEFKQAETAFEAAVRTLAEGGLEWAAAIAEGNLAYLATRQGRLERALLHFERARRCLEADESPADLARLMAEQADAFALLGLPAEALQTYERALPFLQAHALPLETAQARAGLGKVRLQFGRLEEAERDLAQAASELEHIGQEFARARLDLIRAELAARSGRVEEAQTLAEDALETLSLRPSDAALAHDFLARHHLSVGDLSGAAVHIAAALPIAERLDLAPLRANLLHSRGLIKRQSATAGEALRDLRSAVDQLERVRGVLQAERFRSAFLGSHLAIYEDAVLAALDSETEANPAAEAFALVERAKGRALLDLIGGALDSAPAAGSVTADPVEANLIAEFGRVRAELNWRYSQSDDDAVGFAKLEDRKRWRSAITRLEADFDALEDRLAAARGIAGLYAPPLDLDDALQLVPDEAALIEFFAAGDEVLAFVLSAGGVAVFRRLDVPDDLAERVGRVHFQIGRALASSSREISASRSERQLADARRELGDLHRRLIAPLMEAIEGFKRLIIVPHGPLHALPFNALWDGDQYLVERFEIIQAPSASVLAYLAAHRRTPNGSAALVLGVPDRLAPWIEAEASHVAQVLGVTPVLGSAATADRLIAEAPRAAIIHLACHGRFSPDSPLASGLRMADRWLTVRDVYALRLSASLVTLSGCETGRSVVNRGDELVGLIRGCLAAGASSVLLSLWVVNDESAAELMTDFYGAYSRGFSPAAALRSAQCALMERKSHPASWAPFVLGGMA